MRFVGHRLPLPFEQAGTNCGLAGKNAVVEVDGAVYWLSKMVSLNMQVHSSLYHV